MAMTAMKMSEWGSVWPFFRSEADRSPAFCQRALDISTYFRWERVARTCNFSLSDFTPCASSKRTTPHVHTASSRMRVSSASPVPEFCLKNSIQTLVSASMLLLFSLKELLPHSLRFDLAFFLFFPVVIDLDLTSERKQVHHFLLPDEFLDRGGYRFGLGFFTGGFLRTGLPGETTRWSRRSRGGPPATTPAVPTLPNERGTRRVLETTAGTSLLKLRGDG